MNEVDKIVDGVRKDEEEKNPVEDAKVAEEAGKAEDHNMIDDWAPNKGEEQQKEQASFPEHSSPIQSRVYQS